MMPQHEINPSHAITDAIWTIIAFATFLPAVYLAMVL